MTTVSSAGDFMLANNAAASAAMKRVDEGGRLLSSAFVVAQSMEEVDMSIPKEDLNKEDRVMVKRPEPEYASMR